MRAATLGAAVLTLAARLATAAGPTPTPAASTAASPSPFAGPAGTLTVLFLGDSMSLCGFGVEFDKRLRADPRVKAEYTYMACGTLPAVWLKRKPYEEAKTSCGYITVLSQEGADKPDFYEDNYGVPTGHKPGPHAVPKLEDLLPQYQPDILVMQTGDNLFDIFRDNKTVAPERHTTELEGQVKPFVDTLATSPSLRRVYWVSPPISGRVSVEIQDFVLDQVKKIIQGKATLIDSRPFFEFPYKHMEADKEHFVGPQMNEWADKVYEIIAQDLTDHPLPPPGALLPPGGLAGSPPPVPPPKPVPLPAPPTTRTSVSAAIAVGNPAPSIPPMPLVHAAPTPMPVALASAVTPAPVPASEADDQIWLSATLASKSSPIEIRKLLPYQESLVAYVYNIRHVAHGTYTEPQILVMHPAHIALKPQPLDKYKVGEIYTLKLRELTGTQWESVKSSDESGRIDLIPYIQIADDARYPGDRP